MWRRFTDRSFRSQRANNTESVSLSWPHHGIRRQLLLLAFCVMIGFKKNIKFSDIEMAQGIEIRSFGRQINTRLPHAGVSSNGIERAKNKPSPYQWRHNERDGVSKTPVVTIFYSTFCSGADQRKYQSSASLAFVRGIYRWSVQRASNAENVSNWWRHHDNRDFAWPIHITSQNNASYMYVERARLGFHQNEMLHVVRKIHQLLGAKWRYTWSTKN